MKSKIMYIENKTFLSGSARIGRVFFSKTGKTIYYKGMSFQSLKGAGFKANYYNLATGVNYWISGCKKNGGDRLYGGDDVEIDEDIREEYWINIRKVPDNKNQNRT